MIIVTALEYQQCLMALPAPNKYSHRVVRVAVIKQDGERKIEYVRKLNTDEYKDPTQFVEMREIEFELLFDKPIPYWQPSKSVTIIPVKLI